MPGVGITDYRISRMLLIPSAESDLLNIANGDVSISFRTKTGLGNPEVVQIWKTRHDIRAGDI